MKTQLKIRLFLCKVELFSLRIIKRLLSKIKKLAKEK